MLAGKKKYLCQNIKNMWIYFLLHFRSHIILSKKSYAVCSIPETLQNCEEEPKRTQKRDTKHVKLKLITTFKTFLF
jgi:hypothetical protein